MTGPLRGLATAALPAPALLALSACADCGAGGAGSGREKVHNPLRRAAAYPGDPVVPAGGPPVAGAAG